MNKISIVRIWKGYLGTLQNYNTKKAMPCDIVVQVAFPIVAAVALVLLAGMRVDASLAASIAGVIATFAALMCAVAVMVFQLKLQVSASKEDERVITERGEDLIDELFADLLWAISVGFLVVLIILVGNKFLDGPVLSAIVIMLLLHFFIVTFMCVQRMSAAYKYVDSKHKQMRG